MPLWRCADGGFHDGNDCYVDFRRHLRGTKKPHDIQIVRIVDRHTLAAHLDNIGHPVDPDTIDAVLRGLIELTPDSNKVADWRDLFNNVEG